MKNSTVGLNRKHHQSQTSTWLPTVFSALVIFFSSALFAQARSAQTEARIAGFSGKLRLRRNALPLLFRKGDRLLPNDEIDTTGGGSLRISFSDGSLVIIAPGSIAVLKDFRQANSLRELLDLALGRVRIKIKKLGGRPNPYRVNSPTTSIAVRGTEFTVRVESSGETEVAVSEGLVEVTSRLDQNQKTLVEPGRSVIVRPSGDIGLNRVGPGNEMDARIKPLSDQKNFYYRDSEYTVTYGYNIYNRAITERTLNNSPSRFAAFADAHFDSLLNPAYAAEFKRTDGRFYLSSSLSRPFERINAPDRSDFKPPHPFDQTLSLQTSYFVPLGSRWVVGGAISKSDTGLESSAVNELPPSFLDFSQTLSFNGTVKTTTVNTALVAARRFGQGERSSLGLKIERLESRAALQTTETAIERLTNPPLTFSNTRLGDSRSRSHRTTIMLGLTHDFARGDKLGLSYSYGAAAGGFRYRTDQQTFAFDNSVTAKQIDSLASEASLLLRGPVTRRLFYGLEASLLSERITDNVQYKLSALTQHRRARQPRAGGGFGIALHQKTLLSLDLSFARQTVLENKVEITAGDFYPDSQRYSATFLNGHLGLQSDLGQRFLAHASAMRVYERRYFNLFDLYQNRYSTFSTFGFGWRVRPGWLAQYFFSTDYGKRGPSHTLLLRYDFSQ